MEVLLISHLGLATGMKAAVEQIKGRTPEVSCLEISPDQTLTAYRKHVHQWLDEKEMEDKPAVAVVVDSFLGSPAQALEAATNRASTFVIGGMNLTLILELLKIESRTPQEQVYRAVEMAKRDLTTFSATMRIKKGRHDV